MPLFRRPDGDLVTDESPMRTILPFVLRGRNESAVYHDEQYDIARARKWLRAFNQAHSGPPAGLFHLFIWGCARGLHKRPFNNRFVSGGELYQRKGAYISFAAKKEMRDDAPFVSIKLKFGPDDSFEDTVKRINDSIVEGRSPAQRTIDKELALFMKVPRILRGPIMSFLQWLDRVNLAPAFMIENDPLYTSLFVANLGSVGLDHTTHHLYEVGTCSLFAALGSTKKEWGFDRHGQPVARELMTVRWTLDERVADGFYSAASLKFFRKIIEDPAAFIDGETAGPAAAAADS